MLYNSIPGIAGFFLAAFILMIVLIRPLWVDIDKFISQATGLQFPWVAIVTALTGLISCGFTATFLRDISNPQANGFPVFSTAALIIWAAVLAFLLYQIRLSLFSIVSLKRLSVIMAAFSIFCTAVCLFFIDTGNAGFRQPGIIVASVALVSAGFFIMMTVSSMREENSRWPAVAHREHSDWKAHWITSPESRTVKNIFSGNKTPQNTWICFRKNFDIRQVPVMAEVRIAADSKYRLWMNGRSVVAEGGLKRGPNPFDTYYDTIDIAPYLAKGANTVAILVWHFGRDASSHKNSGRAGLIFDCKAEGLELFSDLSWKVKVHPAFSGIGEPLPNFRLAEANVLFDARKDIAGWEGSGYDDSGWSKALDAGKPPVSPWNNLVPRPIPFFRDYGIKDYAPGVDCPFTSDGDSVICSLPYNSQIQPSFTIKAPDGLLVDMRTDDYRGGGEYGIRSCYITKEGNQAYEAPIWMNGHKVIYTFPTGVEILSLKYRETGYDADFTGTFISNEPFYNRLWQKAQRTLYITMRDSYMDCPDRERAQWWWDAALEIGESFYALDPRSHLLAKKAMLELASWQKNDGTLYSPVPSGNWNIELPLQMLASIGWYGFYTYYLNTGDSGTIKAVYPAAKRYLERWKMDEKGVVSIRKGGWNWGDWGREIDIKLLTNCWYYLAIKGLEQMALVSDKPDDARVLGEKMRMIQKSFNDNFWRGNAYRSPGYRGETDDRGNALAVCAGLADKPIYPAIREVLLNEYHASPCLEKHVDEALFIMGYDRDALARMKKRFGEMVDATYSTLWEGWEIDNTEYGGGTINHAWSGGSLTLLSMYAAGIRPTKPGYSEYEVMPQMGSLGRISCTVPSVRGAIEVGLEKDDKSFRLSLSSPSGTSAVIGIPAEYKGDISITDANGNIHDALNTVPEGITSLGFDGDFKKFKAMPGKWVFLSRK